MANDKTNDRPVPAMQLTAEDLQKIIASAIAAAKEPNELEKLELEEKRVQMEARRAQIEQDQITRKETAQQQLQIIENKKLTQKICTHKHRKGDTHCVYIADELGGFILCQKCQAVIRPGVPPKGYSGTVIYDTDLYNRLFQDSASNGVWD